jgi:small subunit ribosomal protein S20
MPNIKSAMKRMKTSEKSRLKNRGFRSRAATARLKFEAAIEAGDKEEAMRRFSAYASALDKSTKSGAIKKNTASRGKSRAAKRLAAIAG